MSSRDNGSRILPSSELLDPFKAGKPWYHNDFCWASVRNSDPSARDSNRKWADLANWPAKRVECPHPQSVVRLSGRFSSDHFPEGRISFFIRTTMPAIFAFIVRCLLRVMEVLPRSPPEDSPRNSGSRRMIGYLPEEMIRSNGRKIG